MHLSRIWSNSAMARCSIDFPMINSPIRFITVSMRPVSTPQPPSLEASPPEAPGAPGRGLFRGGFGMAGFRERLCPAFQIPRWPFPGLRKPQNLQGVAGFVRGHLQWLSAWRISPETMLGTIAQRERIQSDGCDDLESAA